VFYGTVHNGGVDGKRQFKNCLKLTNVPIILRRRSVRAVMRVALVAMLYGWSFPVALIGESDLGGTVALVDRRARLADDVWAVRSDRSVEFVECRAAGSG
jgi:hypothetical protein